jgi:aryl-alcohol dehydrogenase-like predicted oxidoreductase
MNLVLGSANFGSIYGITNKQNQLGDSEVFSILKSAQNLGIDSIDTAPVYGRSEELIGRYHQSSRKFRIHSKIPKLEDRSLLSTLDSIDLAILRLHIDRFEIIYFHDSETLYKVSRKTINELITTILESGKVGRIGVSVYTEEEILRITQDFPTITTFQVPENILDQRLINSQLMSTLARNGYTFYVRSIFLQGLTLLAQEQVPTAFRGIQPQLREFSDFASERNLSKLQASLSYLKNISWASGFIVGVNSRKQLEQVVAESRLVSPLSSLPDCLPKVYSDPRNWSTFEP